MNNLFVTLFLNKLELICLHTVKWFQVLLSNTNNSIWFWLFTCFIVKGDLKIGKMVSVHQWPGRLGFNLQSSHTQKLVRDASLLNTHHYKVWIKGKWNNPGKWVVHSSTPQCGSYWKRVFRLPSTVVGQLFPCTQLNGFKYCYLTLITLFVKYS